MAFLQPDFRKIGYTRDVTRDFFRALSTSFCACPQVPVQAPKMKWLTLHEEMENCGVWQPE